MLTRGPMFSPAGPETSAAGRSALLPQISTPLRLLVVDDDPPVRRACAEIAAALGFAVRTADSVDAARTALEQASADLLLLDMKLPGGGGLGLLEEVRALSPRTVVVVMSAFATVDTAVEAMRIGASDYLTKPFTLDELSATLNRSVQNLAVDEQSRQLRERLRTGRGMGQIVGQSPAMEKLYRIVSKVAATSHAVLVLGESGTGKELIARAVHSSGPNADRAFLRVDCGSLSPAQMGIELFGDRPGLEDKTTGPEDKTSAVEARAGVLAAAEGATVLLDEVAELPLDLQGRLLQALQERLVRPAGSNEAVPLTARLIAATSRDLEHRVATGRFRKDLYYRLNVVNLRIPPLRERKGDIPLLAGHFLERLRRDHSTAFTLSDDSLRLMMEYDWPGNIGELEHALERACALSSGPVLHLGDFPTQLQNHRDQQEREPGSGNAASTEQGLSSAWPAGSVTSIAGLERQAILRTLRQLDGDKLMAARLLGIGKTTLYRKLKEYGIAEDQSLL